MGALPDDIYVGEDIMCLVKATDPLKSGAAITDADVSVEFFAPGKNPKSVPADRTSPDDESALTYDATRGGYYGLVSTAGWADGTWSFRVVLSGTVSNWGYGTFRIKP